MNGRKKMILEIILSTLSLAGILWWLTVSVLPNVGIVHFVPMKEPQAFPDNGLTLLTIANGKMRNHRVVESCMVGWPGVAAAWLHILVGMIIGAGAGYLMGLPKRHLIEFAEKSVSHAKEMVRIAEKKESSAAQKLSAAEAKEAKNSQRSAELDRREKELKPKSDEVEQLRTYAHMLIREVEAAIAEKNKELAKANATIRRLKKRNKEKTIDEDDEQD